MVILARRLNHTSMFQTADMNFFKKIYIKISIQLNSIN